MKLNEEMGLGMVSVSEKDQKGHTRILPFRFGKIKDYGGEYVRELRRMGIWENAEVIVAQEEDGSVSRIAPAGT